MQHLFEFDLEYDEQGIFGKDKENDLEYLLSEIDKYDTSIDKEIVIKAFNYCYDKHKDTKRKSGYLYYTHPLNVALILLREFSIHDTASLVAALLHDLIEDVAEVGENEIADLFGADVAEIVQAVTKISSENMPDIKLNVNIGMLDKKQLSDIKQKSKAGTHRKLFLALVRDIRVILIKLADRLHNLRTLHYLKPEKQIEIANETLNFYIPITHRLGLTKIKTELENRSFYYYNKSAYEAIRSALSEKRRDFMGYFELCTEIIRKNLNLHNIDHIITIIHKHEYEIHKMMNEGKDLSEIDNFYSIVIILKTNDIHECYRAHGVLASAFNTINFIDFIAKPKVDWYKSLVTELYGPDGKRIEIILRTEEMEKIAEEGFASKFSLRSGRIRALNFSDRDIDEWGDWMQGIIEERGENATQIIWDAIKVNLFDSELTVYTKNGQTVTLPEGATIIDFAFALSDDIGLHCISGKVNGVVTELSYKLKSGDQIDIIYSPKYNPKPEWQEYVVSHKAVSKLHQFFKNNAVKDKTADKKNTVFESKIKIKGQDRELMLHEITEAIGKSIIKRISLDTSGVLFEGIVTVKSASLKEINAILAKLMDIKGIKSVIKVNSDSKYL